MKKIFLVGFILLFMLLLPQGATAADVDPYQVSGCETDPDDPPSSDICRVRYDIVNSVLRPSQTDVTTGTSPLVGLQKIANMIWAGIVRPAGNDYALGTPKSVPYGNQVEDASFQDLTPAALQDVTIHNANPILYSVTSRLCVANPVTGGLAGEFITRETWNTAEDIPGAVAQSDGTQRLASYTTRYVNPSQNFTKPDIRVKKMVPPSCGDRADGDAVDQSTVTTVKENRFTEEDRTSIPYTITDDMQTEQTVRDKLGNLITRFIARFPVPATHVAGGTNPLAGHNLCNGPGCSNPEDLDPVTYINDEQKQSLRTGGGWINSMYRSDAFDPNYTVGLNAKFLKQEFEALFTKANTADTTVYAMRRTEEAQTFANCNLLTEEEQKLPDYQSLNCDKSWVAPISTEGEWNCNSSAPATANASSNDGEKAYADTVYGSCSSGTDNAWTKCKNDVIARATKACVDPTFTLAIWLHESGASNYKCGRQLNNGEKIQDFGINVAEKEENFSQQLDGFLKLPTSYAANCPSKTLQDFISVFYLGVDMGNDHYACYNELTTKEQRDNVNNYITELQEIYASIAPGKSLPTWPKGSCSGSPP